MAMTQGNITDARYGKALGADVERYIEAHPETTEKDIAEALGMRPAKLAEAKHGKEAIYAREIKAACRHGMFGVLRALAADCGARLVLLPRGFESRPITPVDAMTMLKEATEAASKIVESLSDGRITAGERTDCLREIEDAELALLLVRRLVEEAKTTRGYRDYA